MNGGDASLCKQHMTSYIALATSCRVGGVLRTGCTCTGHSCRKGYMHEGFTQEAGDGELTKRAASSKSPLIVTRPQTN